MGKYWHLIKSSFSKSLAYRSEVFLWLVLDTIPTLVLIFVWINIYQSQEVYHGYTLSQVLQYYLLASLVNGITAGHFEAWRVEQIRKGQIDFHLTKPIEYLAEIFWYEVGAKAYYITFSVSLLVLLYLGLSLIFPFGTLSFTPLSALTFAILMILSFGIEFLFGLIIVLLGFWFEYSEGLEHFKWIIVTLLSGWMIPIALMPDWLATIVQTLPFKYMYAIPIGILQQTAQFNFWDLLYMLSFVTGLLILVLWLWKNARFKYSSHGG